MTEGHATIAGLLKTTKDRRLGEAAVRLISLCGSELGLAVDRPAGNSLRLRAGSYGVFRCRLKDLASTFNVPFMPRPEVDIPLLDIHLVGD